MVISLRVTLLVVVLVVSFYMHNSPKSPGVNILLVLVEGRNFTSLSVPSLSAIYAIIVLDNSSTYSENHINSVIILAFIINYNLGY